MLKKNIIKPLVLAISTVTLFSTSVGLLAAGFQLKEQSAEGQGNSFAGQTAKAVDASTIFFNPAGMTRIKGNEVQSNLSYIAPQAKYSHQSSSSLGGLFPKKNGINGGESAFVPAAYALWDYSDEMKFGLSINAPFGLSTKFDENWVGAQYNVFSEVKTINLAPSIAYKVNDKLSVGGNVQFQKIEGELTNKSVFGVAQAALTKLSADDTGFGYGLGLLYEYSDRGRVGFNYRSQIKHTLKGKVSTASVPSTLLNFNATADLTLPAVASLGIYHEVSDQWALLADIAWTDWSQFDELQVVNTDTNTKVANPTQYNWDDTVFAAIGANYQYSDKLQLKFGIAYDQGAANDDDRTAGIPDATRYWTSIGASYQLNKKTRLNLGYSHIEAKQAKVTEGSKASVQGAPIGSRYSGEFNPKVDILSLGVSYRF